jgi:hypothetical protein
MHAGPGTVIIRVVGDAAVVDAGGLGVGVVDQLRAAGQNVVASHLGFPELGHGADLRFQAARSYSLIRPPRTGRRLIRS